MESRIGMRRRRKTYTKLSKEGSMENQPKYLYTDGILKGKENHIFLILNEKEPSNLLNKGDKIAKNPLCTTLEKALSFLQETGY